MSQHLDTQNVTVSPKKRPVQTKKTKRGTLAAILLSGVVIITFVTYYLIVGEESRKKNSLQLVIAVSKYLN